MKLFFRLVSRTWEVFGLKLLALTLAFACTVIVLTFAIHEFTYDTFHPQANKTFRILQRQENEKVTGNPYTSVIPAPRYFTIKDQLKAELTLSQLRTLNGLTVVSSGSRVTDQRIHVTDGDLTEVLYFKAASGSLHTFKSKNRTAMLSASAAIAFFNTIDISGKQISLFSGYDTVTCTVAAVFEDFPANSHDAFEFIVNLDSVTISDLGYDTRRSTVYGKLSPGADLVKTQEKVNQLVQTKNLSYTLQPLPEIYFGRRVTGENARHGDEYSISILLVITGLILFLATITYINLTTLSIPPRAKEIAIKKVAGATHTHLTFLFMRESFFLTSTALLLAALLVAMLSPVTRSYLQIDLPALIKTNADILLIIMGVLFTVVVIAPVIVILKFIRARPTRLLSEESLSFPALKRVITFLQLGTSLFLIVGSLIVQRQINHSLIKEPGRNFYQVAVIPFPQKLNHESFYNLKTEWPRSNAHVVEILGLSHLPSALTGRELNTNWHYLKTDPDFISFFGLKPEQGRWFKGNAENAFVINRKGIPLANKKSPPIGVIENFGYRYGQSEIPLKIEIGKFSEFNFLCIKVLEVDIRETAVRLSVFADSRNPAPVSFLDNGFVQWLSYEDKLNSLSRFLALISAILSGCAIYGLSISLARDKAKQIAIHKISGASVVHIIFILVNQLLKPLCLTLLIIGPVAVLLITEWLRKFAYATRPSFADLFIAVGFCSAIVLLTCSYQAMKLNRVSLSASLKK
jgi:putative ABC transport system permease protein